MRRLPLAIVASLLLARGAAAQPVPRVGGGSGESESESPTPGDPEATATVAATTTPEETPTPATPPAATAATPTPVPTLALEVFTIPRDASTHAPAPGEDLHLQPPTFAGDTATALGNPAIFAALSPMQKAWFLREFHRARGDAEAAKDALGVLVELRVDSGLWNATSYASALVREARAAVAAGHGAEAVAAAKAATDLAPDFPGAHVALARAEMANGEITAAPAAFQAAASAAFRNLRSRVEFFGNLLMALVAGAWVAYALFLAIVALRHGRFLAHDFRHAFADRMPVWLATVILIPFLAFPLVFGLGPLPLLAWLTLALWIQMSSRERVVAFAFLAFGAAMPISVRQIGAALAFEGGDESLLYRAIREDEVDAHTLAALTASGDATKDADVLLTVANVHARAGRYGFAESFYLRAADAGYIAPAQVGIGFVHYGMGDVPGAIAAFEKAVGADSQHVAARFDLSQIYAERTELEKSQANLHTAKSVDAKRCDRILSSPLPPTRKNVPGVPGLIAPAYVNHFLLLDDVSDERLLARTSESGAADAVVRKTWGRVSPAISMPALASIFLGAIVVGAALSLAFKGVVPARPCHKCGTRLCLRCDGPPLEDDLCVQCFHTFRHTEGTDPRIRAEKERSVVSHRDRRRRLRWVFSVLVPGGGLLLGGQTVRGAVLLIIACLFAARLVLRNGVLRPVFPDGGGTPVAAIVVAGLILFAVWIQGMSGLDADPERGR